MWRGGANTFWPLTRHITLTFLKRKIQLCGELCTMVRNLRAWWQLFGSRKRLNSASTQVHDRRMLRVVRNGRCFGPRIYSHATLKKWRDETVWARSCLKKAELIVLALKCMTGWFYECCVERNGRHFAPPHILTHNFEKMERWDRLSAFLSHHSPFFFNFSALMLMHVPNFC